ncbi:TerC family protein [Rhodohalobacter sulfatireducens]|uniref:TerC family protein n=1 Tax=Rhodohalobacter sulfatireducens TaxID=2911366 RepID=A0ABS9K7V2_9BACT|nr:TerC family protein [Rhodohalobacter sulfatireducens]MCG2586936.1 TerC family protein [Rhodohalobacter sulfatireducens]
MEIFLSPEAWIALLTLTFLEIVLGVDNIIFISIVSNKLPVHQQKKARTIGLFLALVFRILMLLTISWIIGFTEPLFSLFEMDFSIRDLILFVGGIFLIFKSTIEIHHKMEGQHDEKGKKELATFGEVIFQIVALDVIFSFDSILTAIGLTEEVLLMIIAITIAIGVMIAFTTKISEFIKKHPTLEVLALSFLILIGFMLMIEAFEFHVPKGYIYFAVFFSLLVELVNMRIRKNKDADEPVKLRKRFEEESVE